VLDTIRAWPGADRFPDFELRRVEIGPDAFERLPDVLRQFAPGAEEVIVVQDPQPMRRGADELKPWLERQLEAAGLDVDVVELQPGRDGEVHADFEQLERVQSQLRSGVPVVALGSGTVTDVAKHACFRHQAEHDEHLWLVLCPTAVSVLAFTARMAVIAKDGVKRTWPSRLGDALLFDLETLRAAPHRMTLAGFGDLAPVYTSFADWRLGEMLGMATVSRPSYELLADVRANLPEAAPEVREGTAAGLETLAKMNVLGGLSATLAGESAPLSGYEHVTGHMLDMGASHFGRGLALHGAQVGVAVLPHAIAYHILLDELDPDEVDIERCYPDPEAMQRRVRDTFCEIDPSGRMADECWSDYARKLEAWYEARGAFERLLAEWPERRAELDRLLTEPADLVGVLAAAGHPLRFPDLDLPIPEHEARWAFDNAYLMRKRFSVGDLYFFLGWLYAGFTDRVFGRRDELVAALT
jgi:glycerol-1-phosphate dehydrogenase [NAD(P)+]